MLTESQTEPEGALAMPAQLHVPGARLRSAAAALLKQARSLLDLLSSINHPVAAVRERNDLITRRVRRRGGSAWAPRIKACTTPVNFGA